jgi:hypothetical protein
VPDKQSGTRRSIGGFAPLPLGLRISPEISLGQGTPFRIPAAETAPLQKNLIFFEMSAPKNFRKGEPNRVNQPKLHMNLVVDAPLSKTPDFSSPFMLFSAPSELENSGKQPTSRISREAMDAFLNAKSDNARSAHFSAPAPEPPAAMPEKGLALGVLKQAAHDLRRFSSATRGVRRELYVDAYDWITANDFSWQYSFVNICKVLNVCPEVVRTELFADASLSWFDYWTKRAGRVSAKLRASFVRVFANCPNTEGAEASQLASSI